MKRTFRLSERELKNMIAESVRRALYESEGDEVDMLWDELKTAKENGADKYEILDILHRLEGAIDALPQDDPRAFRRETTFKRKPGKLGDTYNGKKPEKTWRAKVSNFRNEKGEPTNPFRKPKDWNDDEEV